MPDNTTKQTDSTAAINTQSLCYATMDENTKKMQENKNHSNEWDDVMLCY